MWLGLIVPPLREGQAPQGLESTTTLVIQVLDLGIIMPIAFLWPPSSLLFSIIRAYHLQANHYSNVVWRVWPWLVFLVEQLLFPVSYPVAG